jgi:hypothetical protein
MSDTANTPPATPSAQTEPPKPTPPASTPPAATPPAAQQTDWETEAKKWEKRAKENFEKAQKLDQIEVAAKSDMEKLQDKLNATEQEGKDGIVSAFREAAVTFGGIKLEDAETFLTGTDVDTLKKQAARLAEFSNNIPGHVPGEGSTPPALNSDALEQSLRAAVGA